MFIETIYFNKHHRLFLISSYNKKKLLIILTSISGENIGLIL